MLLKFLIMYSVLLFCPLWRNLPVVIIDLTGNWLPVSEVLVASHLYYKLSLSAPFKYSSKCKPSVGGAGCTYYKLALSNPPDDGASPKKIIRLARMQKWDSFWRLVADDPQWCVWEVKNDNNLKEECSPWPEQYLNQRWMMLQGFWWFMTVSLSSRLGRPLI